MPGKTRFAPSPTGYLHEGHLLSALYVWAAAQKWDLSVHLRIEDHDQERSRPEHIAAIREDLQWLGFKWQSESLQSDHFDRFEKSLKKLEAQNLVYPCYCSRKELEEQNPKNEFGEIIYQGKCKGGSLPLASASGVIASGAKQSQSGVVTEAPATPSPRGAAPKTPDARPEQNDPALPGHGRTVLITAGRTEEAIDPVRYISNRSSGKTAVALASVFLANGYSVEVVAGPMEAEFPGSAAVHHVRSACEMHRAVMERLSGADALVHCAAVADYRPKDPAQSKIKDSRSQLVLELVPNPNILRDSVAAKKPNQVVVGFALETDHFEEHAQEKLRKSGANALLLNAPVAKDSGFGFDNVNYALVTPGEKIPEMQMGSKVELSETIVDFVNRKLEERHG